MVHTVFVVVLGQAIQHIGEHRLGLPRVVEIVDVLLQLVDRVGQAVLDVIFDIVHDGLLIEVKNFRDSVDWLLALTLGIVALLLSVIGHVVTVAGSRAGKGAESGGCGTVKVE